MAPITEGWIRWPERRICQTISPHCLRIKGQPWTHEASNSVEFVIHRILGETIQKYIR
jgi:hypothetical protein